MGGGGGEGIIVEGEIERELRDLMLMKNVLRDEPEASERREFGYIGTVDQFGWDSEGQYVEAQLDFWFQNKFLESGSPILCGLLEQLSSCRFMTVCGFLLQIVPSQEKRRTNLDLNVEHLTIKNTALHAYEFLGVKFMLASCPRMETLTIRIGPANIFPDYKAPYEVNSDDDDTAEACLKESLRVLDVMDFQGIHNEIAVITYIIRHGSCLRNVNLYLSKVQENKDKYNEIVREAHLLRELPRANPYLKILVYKIVM